MIRDFSRYAINILTKPSNSEIQTELARTLIHTPVANAERFETLYREDIYSLKEEYFMQD